VELVVDEHHLGQSEVQWAESGRHSTLIPLELSARRVIVVAPHPDDEVLGAGGLIQVALSREIPVLIVAVTDGEASHPRSEVTMHRDLGALRAKETFEALQRLGWENPRITHLHLPDGKISQRRGSLDEQLAKIIEPEDLCVAPWRNDGHPDHDACGESAIEVSRAAGATALGYLVWAWHWAEPDSSDIPWSYCRRLDLARRACARKRWATASFGSQTRSLGPDLNDAAVLPPPILRRFWRPYEVYIDSAEDQ
jgi:LmbE family N-acetylglucosaminyl deacetylase